MAQLICIIYLVGLQFYAAIHSERKTGQEVYKKQRLGKEDQTLKQRCAPAAGQRPNPTLLTKSDTQLN